MVSLINFGNLKTVNGRTVSSGSQSGLDTSSIIESLATAKRLPAVKFEDNIKVNNNSISALTEMKTMLQSLKDAVAKLRKPVGFGSGSDNAFETRNAYLNMSNGATATNYIGVTTANGAPLGKYNIAITNLAVAQNDLSEKFTSLSASVVAGDGSGGPTTGKFDAGTYNIGYTDADGHAQTETITLTAGSNLATVRDTINAKTSKTGVQATIIKFADDDYRLKLYSTETGTENAYTFTNGTGEKVGFTNTAADDARIELDGQQIVRSSNVIDDLIDNTTLTLYQPTASESVTLEIDKNTQGVAEGIAGFLDSYNQMRTFAAKQTEVDENGKPKDTAYLKNSSVLQTIMSKISSIVSGSKGAGLVSPDQLALYGTGNSKTQPTSLADIGIYFTDQPAVTSGDQPSPQVANIMALDVTKLTSQLQKYFGQTRDVFEFSFTSDNSELSSYKRSNAVYDNDIKDFTINIDHSAKTATVTGLKDSGGHPLDPATTTLTYSKSGDVVTLKGVKGTVLEGMEFFYTGAATGTSTANVTVSQGVGDVMFNSLDSYLSSIDGQLNVIDKEIESLKTQNEDAQESIDRIDTMVVSYREQMLDKFSQLEALISASNQTLLLLDAQSNASQNN